MCCNKHKVDCVRGGMQQTKMLFRYISLTFLLKFYINNLLYVYINMMTLIQNISKNIRQHA